MEEKTIDIRREFDEKFETACDSKGVEELRLLFLGKKGKVAEIMATLREVPIENKKEAGRLVNELKNYIEQKISEKMNFVHNQDVQNKINNTDELDISMPVDFGIGSLHPRTIVQRKLEDIFISMGFTVEDGEEVVSEYENFDSVNVPASHPARDMQDTFWLNNGEVLKTQTSALQNRILRKYKGPLKAIFPGRCFRNEALDHSHENTFFQMEGVLVDKEVSVANLIFFMKEMLSKVFEKEVEVRLRPGFFPFVEPGFELDVLCPFCGGKGCSVCKHGSWIELCPCGMIHPKVLELGGIDPEEYSGFAFGLGLDRLTMIKTHLDDIRYLNSGNLKILKQYKLDL